ncbi:unnamed protein product [Kuraishia capsulata CBS 1993]|uniref:V-type proton ATPase subunit a n=1 Tax=Kuraishia capsulata CBS 1993 TaxID=1382522 RepID=W6MRM9_9ASCO|nr:uncharacterized protein KUCA_T00005362001 [Kuraishia capsulata CBS 1993]CDK29374.1 unnamed protein product [Kuraishia capsulata CBS 1993]
MSLVQFYVATEISREVVFVLGDIGNVQFRDLNSNVSTFQRSFVGEIRKYDNTERQLRYLEEVLKRQESSIPLTGYEHISSHGGMAYTNTPTTSQLDDLVQVIDQYDTSVRQLDGSLEGLLARHAGLLEHRHVLTGSRKFFDLRSNSFEMVEDETALGNLRPSSDETEGLLVEEIEVELGYGPVRHSTDANREATDFGALSATMSVLAGTIDRDRFFALQKILWRVLRGNLYINYVPIEEPIRDAKTGTDVYKYIFIIFTHGETLIRRCKKVVDSLDGKIFDVDSNYDVFKAQLDDLNGKVDDVNQVLVHTKDRLRLELKEIAHELLKWKVEIKREKAIYVTMNLFNYDQTRRCLIAEGWIPKNDLQMVKNALRDVTDRSRTDVNSVVNELQTNRVPPTYHKTNKFTDAFQNIIDAYGVATYREVNPALASVVTFPFMFAIMFGDVGHGLVLFLAALVLVLKEKQIGAMKNRDEIFDMAYSGRYILILMGAFSIYTGLLYNDLFSKSMTLFKSGWKWPDDFKAGDSITATQTGTYFLGLDYAWHGTENNLLFTNSYKMKLSILMGFAHMSYSFYFSLVNYKFFKSRVDIIGNFIPGLLFMQSIFGYLSLTIVYKWTIDWIKVEKPAPSLLNMLINMFLSPGTIEAQLYKGQSFVQVVLVIIALVCVPWLLLYKPLTLRRQNSQSVALGYSDIHEHEHLDNLLQSEEDAEDSDFFVIQDFQEPDEEFNFGDVMIHQVIHTIEFCLNCVSHTASYLRLWALSLAHNQLSAVLWDMTISNSFVSYKDNGYAGVIMVVLLFGMWFVLTVCILVVMEGTSAMLHSLRLHWVEAMSKFFEGEGYAYSPFSFEKLLTESEET